MTEDEVIERLYWAFTGDLRERLHYVKLWGDLPPNGRYGSHHGRPLKRIGGELPKFGEATAFLETH
jgi:hypothetical protein